MDEYLLAYAFIVEMDRRFSSGQHLRDCWGDLILTLDALLVAIDEGRWPGPGWLYEQWVEVDYAAA